ncbi:MAG TPA: hypothetical protein VGF95_03435 [Solirubrobacteraceae bacterium]|jgi:hypothetical protein
MHNEPTSAEREGAIDRAILGMMLDSADQRPWSVDEVEREVGERVDDSLSRLYGAGLIHRLEGFVWATRAALAADEIAL